MYRANQNGQPQRANTEPIHQNRVNGRQPPPVNIPMTVSEQFRESWLTAIIGLIMFATGKSSESSTFFG